MFFQKDSCNESKEKFKYNRKEKIKKVIKWSSGEGGQVISKNSQIY